MGMTGCQSAPPGHSGGVIDSGRRTHVDARSREADTVSMREFAQNTGEALAMRIAREPAIRDSPHKIAVYMGRVENRTSTPANDFVILTRNITMGMVNNDYVRRHADVFESRSTMNARREQMGYDREVDLFQEGAGGGGVALYDDNHVYELQGFFGEMTRGGGAQSNYYLEMTLVNLGTGRVAFVEQYEWKQVR
jgi:hypothetical protein